MDSPPIQMVAPVRASVKIGERSFALGPVQWRIMQLLAGGAVVSSEQFHRELYGRRCIGNKKLISTHRHSSLIAEHWLKFQRRN